MQAVGLFLLVGTIQCWTVVQPNSETVWVADTQAQIQWNSTFLEAAESTLIDVDLMVGPGEGVVVMAIGNDVPGTVASTSWNVSKFLSTRSDYFIRLTQAGRNSSVLAYGERFNVVSPSMMGVPPLHKDKSASSSIVFGIGKNGSRIAALMVTAMLLCLFSH